MEKRVISDVNKIATKLKSYTHAEDYCNNIRKLTIKNTCCSTEKTNLALNRLSLR